MVKSERLVSDLESYASVGILELNTKKIKLKELSEVVTRGFEESFSALDVKGDLNAYVVADPHIVENIVQPILMNTEEHVGGVANVLMEFELITARSETRLSSRSATTDQVYPQNCASTFFCRASEATIRRKLGKGYWACSSSAICTSAQRR